MTADISATRAGVRRVLWLTLALNLGELGTLPESVTFPVPIDGQSVGALLIACGPSAAASRGSNLKSSTPWRGC